MRGQIAPLKIVTRKQANPESFSNFMRGGPSSSGASQLSSASNKIVNFSRATTSPVTPDFSSILGSISTSINNNYQSTVQNIYKTVNQTLNNAVNSFKADYQKVVKSKEDSAPSKVLKNFQILYKNTIDFVTFFGDEKNNAKITNALKNLRGVFDGSFDAASKIRQTIGKIVGQLTNLPTASGKGGSLDLEVKVPGEKLRQSGGDSVRSLSRPASGGLGVGVGSPADSPLMNAKRFQEQKLMEGKPEAKNEQFSMFESFIDSMKGIVDSFNSTITDFVNFIKERFGLGRPTPPSSGASTTPPPDDTTSDAISGATPESMALSDLIKKTEGTEDMGFNTIFGNKKIPELTEMTVDEVIQMQSTNKLPQRFGGREAGYSGSKATGAYQIMGPTLRDLKGMLNLKGDEKFTPEMQHKMFKALVKRRGVDPDKPLTVESLRKLLEEWPSLPGGSQNTQKFKSQQEAVDYYNRLLSGYKTQMSTSSNDDTISPINPTPRPFSTGSQIIDAAIQGLQQGLQGIVGLGLSMTSQMLNSQIKTNEKDLALVPARLDSSAIKSSPQPPTIVPIPTSNNTANPSNNTPYINQGLYLGGIPSVLQDCPNGHLAQCLLGVRV